MTPDISGATTYDKIVDRLRAAEALFEIIEHPPEGRTELISAIRGNPVAAAAKAMVIKIKRADGPVFALIVVPGDKRVDMDAVAEAFGGRSASFASPEVAAELTGCEMGAVPPFSFDDRLSLLMDERLALEDRIYFNAARLDRSFAVDRAGYLRAANPRLGAVCR